MSTIIRGVEGVKKVSEMLGDYQRSLTAYKTISDDAYGFDTLLIFEQNGRERLCEITREELMSVFQARIKDNAVKLENIGIKVADAYSEGK